MNNINTALINNNPTATELEKIKNINRTVTGGMVYNHSEDINDENKKQ
tara:strand:+ start:3039 stop:3182 length:144 start_codon:yes stop_codon:yes gene_type:complete